jgi:hypothetical protein
MQVVSFVSNQFPCRDCCRRSRARQYLSQTAQVKTVAVYGGGMRAKVFGRIEGADANAAAEEWHFERAQIDGLREL